MQPLMVIIRDGLIGQCSESQSRRRLKLVGIVFACALLFCGTSSAFADPITERLPQSTAGWIRLNHVKKWSESTSDSPLQKFWAHEAFRPFRKSVSSIQSDGQLEEQMGLEWKEIQQAADGDVLFAIVPLKGDRFASILAIETAGAEQAEQLHQIAHERFTQRGVPVRRGSMDELRVSIYRLSSNDQERCFARFGAWLLIADETAPFARFASADRNKPGLSEYPVFEKTRELSSPNSDKGMHVDWYVDPWRFGRDHISYRLGFSVVRGVGGRMTFGVGENLLSYETTVVTNGALEKAAKMLSFQKANPPRLPDWYADTDRSIQVLHIDYETMLSGYAVWFDHTHGEGDEGLFETILEDIRLESEGPRVDIRRVVVANLNGPLIAVEVGGAEKRATVYAIEVKNEAQVAKAIGRLFEGDPDVSRKEVAGVVAWRYGDLTRGGNRSVLGPNLSDVTLCVANDHLFVTRSVDALEDVLKRGSGPHESSKTFNRIFDFANGKGVPAAFCYGASNELGSLRPWYEALRKKEFSKPKAKDEQPSQAWMTSVWETIESSPMLSAFAKSRFQLPESEAIRPLIDGSVSAGRIDRQGWTLFGRIQLED